jgi:hypothetical protein
MVPVQSEEVADLDDSRCRLCADWEVPVDRNPTHFFDATILLSLAVITVVAATLRALTRPLIAWHLTTFIGGLVYAICPGIATFSRFLSAFRWSFQDGLAFFTFNFVTPGFGFAWTIFLVLDGTCRIADKVDRLIEKETTAAPDDR